jgi:hypothetical protein
LEGAAVLARPVIVSGALSSSSRRTPSHPKRRLKAVATVAPPTTDDLHAKIAAVDRRIEELRSERAELAREVARRQLVAYS